MNQDILLIIFTFLFALGVLLPSVITYQYLKISIKSVTFQKDKFTLHFRNGKKIPIPYESIRKIEKENDNVVYYSGIDFDFTFLYDDGIIPSNKLSEKINGVLLERLRKQGKKVSEGITLKK